MRFLKLALPALPALICLALALPAQAAPELITNGNFSSSYSVGTQSASTPSQLNYNGYGVTSWTSSPSNAYNFLFNPTLAGSAGYSSSGQDGTIQLYTSANGGSATAPNSLVSPVGGNFLAGSGAYQTGSISQVVNNLSVRQQYNLSFYWAASQQAGFTGNTTDSWAVTFGNESFSTATVTNPSQGFTPWMRTAYTFTATSASQTLSFQASGGPSGGQRPFVLLDGVSLQAAAADTPEPGSSALFALGGLPGAGMIARRRRKVQTA